jgi:hypothetical protein
VRVEPRLAPESTNCPANEMHQNRKTSHHLILLLHNMHDSNGFHLIRIDSVLFFSIF